MHFSHSEFVIFLSFLFCSCRFVCQTAVEREHSNCFFFSRKSIIIMNRNDCFASVNEVEGGSGGNGGEG